MTAIADAAQITAPPSARLLADDLRDALTAGRISALYQPIVRLADRRPVGVEVLARLAHPSRGTLGAEHFVLPMEDAGLARHLTEAVIRRACADWHEACLGRLGLTMAVNIPLDVLLIPEALDGFDGLFAAAGIGAERVVIELTESQPVARLPELAVATARLRARGYGLAIDDVGPDIRDHSALLDLPFTMLKLDRSLVQAAACGHSARFLGATLNAARQAGFAVVAEGVEDAGTWALMDGLAVDHAQGFFVSRPLSAGSLADWHARWETRPA